MWWFAVKSGVRQGGVLSPLIFSVFVNLFIVNIVKSGFGCHLSNFSMTCLMYADDLVFLSACLMYADDLVLLSACLMYADDLVLLSACLMYARWFSTSFSLFNVCR